jgi:excisionase family DNA binding protein
VDALLHPITRTGKTRSETPTVVDLTGLGRTKIYEEIASGRLKSVQVGRRRFVRHADLEEYVARLAGDAA